MGKNFTPETGKAGAKAPARGSVAKSAAVKAVKQIEPPKAETGKGRVRDRIFETACDLFYHQGIRCVGVDAIASEAGTNKMSFYRSFGSKDELVAEYLREQVRQFWEWWDGVVAEHPGDARRQVQALFDGYVAKAKQEDSYGCAFVNAAVEIREPDHPALAVVHEHKTETRRRFHHLAVAMGASCPHELGDALTLLAEGSAMSRLSYTCQKGPCINVGNVVRKLIDAYVE